jgi:IclR family acetate operon transcriptional repressor
MTLNENGSRRAVPTVLRTFRILEALAGADRGRGVSELSLDLGLAKSTTFSILNTLEQLGYVFKDDASKYYLSAKLFSLGSVVVNRMDSRKAATPILRHIVEETRETANLATLQRGEGIIIDTFPGPHTVTVNTFPGERVSLHSTAIGKALLAWLPDEEREAILANKGLLRRTPKTITSLTEFKAELRQTRERGYSTDDEEDFPGLRCVGAPVFDHTGRVVAAISLTVPAQRLPVSKMEALAAVVVAGAMKVSNNLGYLKERTG